jgi:hypothetical protein
MNIVEAFLELDKLNEEAEVEETEVDLSLPPLTLMYPSVTIDFGEGSWDMDIEFEVDGWEIIEFLLDDKILKEEDFPEYFKIDPEDTDAQDKWLHDNFDDLVSTYDTIIEAHYENSTDFEHACERAEESAYENWCEYDYEMRVTHGRGYDYEDYD